MSKTPTILTREETERLLNAIKYPEGPRSMSAVSFRNYLIALFMLDCGLRVSEVVQLRRWMIRQDGIIVHSLTVPCDIAKNHKQRIIPLTTRLKTELDFLVEHFWISNIESRLLYLFYKSNHTEHITARRVQQIIKTAGLATLGRRVWPHVLRHTFATRLMRVTSTRVVQELLGHKNLTSTQIYTHPNSQDLLNAIDGLNTT